MKKEFSAILLILVTFSAFSQLSYQTPKTLIEYQMPGASAYYYIDWNQDQKKDIVFHRESHVVYKAAISDTVFSRLDSVIISSTESRITWLAEPIDFDEDGDLDLLLVTESSIVAYTNEDGILSMSATFAYDGFYVRDGELLDYNQDGLLDLVLVDQSDLVWISDIIGTPVSEGSIFSVENAATIQAFSLRDVNEDNILDLFYTTSSRFEVQLAGNQGFNSILSIEQENPYFELADINGDGVEDLAVSFYNESFSRVFSSYTFENNQFQEIQSFESDFMEKTHLIDVDNDGTVELIYSNAGEIFTVDNVNGLFELTNRVSLIDLAFAGNSIREIIPVFANDDSLIDVLVYSFDRVDLLTLGDNQEVSNLSTTPIIPTSRSLVVEDLDGDGIDDILQLQQYGNLTIFWGGGKFAEDSNVPVPSNGTSLSLVDQDEDGDLDLFISTSDPIQSAGLIYLVHNEGNRVFSQPQPWKTLNNPSRGVEADIDADGVQEIVFFTESGQSVIWFEKTGNTDVDEQLSSTSKIDVEGFIDNFQVRDVNNDGLVDILVLTQKDILLFTNQGNGSFNQTNITSSRLSNIYGFLAMDYLPNGNIDLLVTTPSQNDFNVNILYIYEGNGTGDFVESDTVMMTDISQSTEFLEQDVDADGDMDFIIGSTDFSRNYYFLNDGDSFEAFANFLPVESQVEVAFGDVNSDGLADAVVANWFSSSIQILSNNSVLEPELGDISLNFDSLSYEFVDLSLSSVKSTGVLVLVKGGSIDGFSELPQDSVFYNDDSEVGSGERLGEGFVSYRGPEKSFRLTGLASDSTYSIAIFPYNSNEPDNTLINYSQESVKFTFETPSALFNISELNAIEMDEDDSIGVDLSDFFFDLGRNQYSVDFQESNIDITIENNTVASIVPAEDYNGSSTITLTVSNDFETIVTSFDLIVRPVNDPPTLQQVEPVIQQGLESILLVVKYNDVDNSSEELTTRIEVSNPTLVSESDIEATITEEDVQFTLLPLDYGKTSLTVFLSDMDLEAKQEIVVIFEEPLGTYLENKIPFYPNPATDFINFKDKVQSVQIFDINGKLIMKDKDAVKKLDISKLSGNTFILVIDGNRKYKLIKK